MNGVTITQNKDYIFIKIPKKQVKKELTEDEALKMFEKNRKDFRQGKLKPLKSLSELS